MLNIRMLKVVSKNYDTIVNARSQGKGWAEIQSILKKESGIYCTASDLSTYYEMISWGNELKGKNAGERQMQ